MQDAGNGGRADALRGADEDAAFSQRLISEIQASIDDPRPNLSHAEVMAEMDADTAAWTT